MDRLFIVLIFVFIASDAMAAKLNKCVDESGHVMFTQAACPGGLSGESITVRSGGSGMTLGPVGTSVVSDADSSHKKRSFNQCGDLTQVDIVYLTSNQKIQVGMTAEDVQKSWGRPDRVNRSSSGSDQWVYERQSHSSQYVYLDGNDCVTAWN